MSSVADQLWNRVESYVAAEHLELDDLEVVGEGSAKIVRVTLDGDALSVDRIADLSRGLSRMLDELDPFEGSYTLEVSSPGLERKLRRPRQYQKAIGSEVKIKTFAPVDGERSHTGTLTQADETSFTLSVNGDPRHIDYDAVANARTVFVWNKTEKPASRP